MAINEIVSPSRGAPESPSLPADILGEIFTIKTENSTGTRFRGPDGRIITAITTMLSQFTNAFSPVQAVSPILFT